LKITFKLRRSLRVAGSVENVALVRLRRDWEIFMR
jgi:hypothetical protein